MRVGIKRHLTLRHLEGDQALLASETGVIALSGAHVAPVADLLDGSHTVEEILNTPNLPAEEVAGVLRSMQAEGLLTTYAEDTRASHDPHRVAPDRGFWDALGLHGDTATATLGRARVRVVDLTGQPLATNRLTTALNEIGILDVAVWRPAGDSLTADAETLRIDTAHTTGTLGVVLTSDYLDPRLATVTDALTASGQPWVLAKPTGIRLWLGPFFGPDLESLTTESPACWHCLAQRLRLHRVEDRPIAHTFDTAVPHTANVALASTVSGTLQMLATEVAGWIAGRRCERQRHLWVLDLATMEAVSHPVRRRPQCNVCGDPDLMSHRASTPIALERAPSPTPPPPSGTDFRTTDPEEVFERYAAHESPLTGITAGVVRDSRGPQLFNSFRSGPNLGIPRISLNGLRSVLRNHSGGKGVTEAQARTSALCEAIERYSGAYQGDELRLPGTLTGWGDWAIDPRDVQLYDERQYSDRATWNDTHGPMLQVPEPFDPEAEVDWTPLWSLSKGETRLLPTSMLYYGAPGPLAADSNGNAAGGTLHEAMLQGLLELIERDAVALWWYNRSPRPAYDLAASEDPWIQQVQECYATLGRDVWVLDVTADLGVPTMVAISAQHGSGNRIMFGFGAHTDRHAAAKRALTELNQAMPCAVTSGWTSEDPDLTFWLDEATINTQTYLLPDPTAAVAPVDVVHGGGAAAQLAALVDRLEAAGLEVLVLDQTRPDIGLPVAKVVCPGLRPFWSRFAPGRLFDVPVALGRAAHPTPYDLLNPVPVFA